MDHVVTGHPKFTSRPPSKLQSGDKAHELFIGHCSICFLFQAVKFGATDRYGVLYEGCQTTVGVGGRSRPRHCRGKVGLVLNIDELLAAYAINGWEAVVTMILADPDRYRPTRNFGT